jgi:hypothetical protein
MKSRKRSMTLQSIAFIVLPVIILLFCYQNCQPPPYSDVINGSQPAVAQSPSVDEKIIADLDTSDVKNVVFNERMPIQMNQSGKVYTLQDLVQFSIDLQTGVIQQLTSQNNLMAKYCLSSEPLEALKTILQAGKVCEYRSSGSPNQLCSQIIIPGYAKLGTSQGDLEVGFSIDSCGTLTTDFCDDRGAAMKEWFVLLKSNLSKINCTE